MNRWWLAALLLAAFLAAFSIAIDNAVAAALAGFAAGQSWVLTRYRPFVDAVERFLTRMGV